MVDIKKLWKQVRKKPNVKYYSGILQPRIEKGKIVEGTKVFRVYVTRKVPKKKLSAKALVPKTLEVDGEKVETDVVEIGVIKAATLQPSDLKHRPAPAGVSAMHCKGTACTLGWFAFTRENTFGVPSWFGVIIANNHCAALENRAELGDEYIQPSRVDGGEAGRDTIGSLIKYVPLKFKSCVAQKVARFFGREDPTNTVDIAAVATLPDKVDFNILNIGQVVAKRDPVEGDIVTKMGRTTGLTKDGVVIDTHWNGEVQYGRGLAQFTDCVLIEGKNFSDGGDSSSAIVTQGDTPVLLGILFAGSNTHTVFCKQSNIERELGVDLVVTPYPLSSRSSARMILDIK